MPSDATTSSRAAAASGAVLLTLASGQFLMTLDSSVMNVSIAQVAEDVGTTITGVQTAITLYTLVMATMMITGGKIGTMIGHRRAFAIGCVIYGAGSLTTALAPSLTVLIIGWSVLEGHRRCADHARDRRPGRRQLRCLRASARLRPDRLGRRDRRGRRTADRRRGHDVLDLAAGLRGRGRRGDRDPRDDPPDPGLGARQEVEDRPGRCRPLRARSRARGLRRAPFRRVGMGAGTRRALRTCSGSR